MDCTRSPELLFPFPRNLGVLPQELIVLTKVVDHLKAKRVVEFGTAEGRTALNIALHLPPGGEIITLDLPPVPGQNEVGFFYWDQPAKTRIKQIFASVDSWDYRPYRASAELVFCDACDRMPGLAAEAYQAFSVVKPGGVILRHDYSTAEGPTRFWEWLARELPVFQIEGTVMLCLRVDSEEVYKKTQALLEVPAARRFQEGASHFSFCRCTKSPCPTRRVALFVATWKFCAPITRRPRRAMKQCPPQNVPQTPSPKEPRAAPSTRP
jgi:hypothetical protein